MKVCSKCGVSKSEDEFYKRKDAPSGIHSQCRICKKHYKAEYKKKNKEKLAEYNAKYKAEYNKKNKEKLAKYNAEYNAVYKKKNKEKLAKYYNDYWRNGVELLSDSYVKRLICAGTNLNYKDIPQSLIKVKREQIKLTRLIKQELN